MLLQVLLSTLITASPGTLSLVGSSADCGCSGRLWCQYPGSLPDDLKIRYRGCKTTLAAFCAVLRTQVRIVKQSFHAFTTNLVGKSKGFEDKGEGARK